MTSAVKLKMGSVNSGSSEINQRLCNNGPTTARVCMLFSALCKASVQVCSNYMGIPTSVWFAVVCILPEVAPFVMILHPAPSKFKLTLNSVVSVAVLFITED